MKTKRAELRKQILGSKFLIPAIGILAVIVGLTASSAIFDKSQKTKAVNCNGICVNIEADGMKPNELALKTGEFVQFNTADNRKHNIALENSEGTKLSENNQPSRDMNTESEYKSGEFGKDEAWRVQFKKPGTYRLYDRNYPENKILIVVYTPKN